MTIVISGGGTGGHLIIAKTLAEELKKRGIKIIFIGSTYGQDQAWFKDSPLFEKKFFLESRGVMNKKFFGKLASLSNILKLSLKCKKIFKEEKVSALISVGGYSAAPASFAALFFRYPFFIHEQNAHIGRLNSLMKNFSKGFYSSYEKEAYPYPVNELFFKKARVRKEKKSILFLGGSQGATFINNLAKELAPCLKEKNFKILHQSGEKDFQSLENFYKEKEIEVELFAFSKNLLSYMEKADLCLSRSGASSLWELCANQLPSIFFPYPYAANNHQYYNALFLKKLGLCELCEEKDANKDKILSLIENLDLEKISLGLKEISQEDGTKKIIDDILLKLEEKKA